MNDVFGRPMDLTPSHPVNKSPLAPAPAESVTPQDDPYVGFSPAPGRGRQAAFAGGQTESLGASNKPTTSMGSAKALINAISPQGTEERYEGAYVISPTTQRPES